MRILGIETSCDETSIAVLNTTPRKLALDGFTVSSQTKLHAKWGGVVPELAARQHAEIIIPLINKTLTQAHITRRQIDLIAVTQGPGLITALQVGVETAKTLSAIWHKPLIGINHIAGHLVSPFLSHKTLNTKHESKKFPIIALVVSGGHAEIYLMKSLRKHKLLGRTIDDAVGEAFDKVAKMLNLPYPGGPQISKLAVLGNAQAFNFPRPMINTKNYNFSFSGLKTAVLYQIQKLQTINHKLRTDICASFQQAAIDVLITKTLHATQKYKAHSILVSGGVSANIALREQLNNKIKTLAPTCLVTIEYPELRFTGDNAAMIALAAAVQVDNKIPAKLFNTWKTLQANANWELWN